MVAALRTPTSSADKLTLDGLLRFGSLRFPAEAFEQSPVMTHRTVVSACTLYLVFKEPDSTVPGVVLTASPAQPGPTARRIGRL